MSRPKPPYTPEPRFLSGCQLAAYLGRSESWVCANRGRLAALGFPGRDPVLGGWDRHAVDAWLDRRAGLLEPWDDPDLDDRIASLCTSA